jgi:hypothetical protein
MFPIARMITDFQSGTAGEEPLTEDSVVRTSLNNHLNSNRKSGGTWA